MVKKIALPVTNDYMVTTLDFAPSVLVADLDRNTIGQKQCIPINESLPSMRANRLKKLQITTVLCGAVSDPLSMLLWHCGIELFSGLTGSADHLLDAFVKGMLPRFHAPDFHPGFRGGCRFGHRRRCHGKRSR